jgi:hypothetical protein
LGCVSIEGLVDDSFGLEKDSYQRFCIMAISRRSPTRSLM